MESMNHMPVLRLLSKINAKQVSPQMLSSRARQNIVEHLVGQGYSVAEMASMLQVSDRTIVRDRKEVRGRNAVFSDEVGLTPRVAGLLMSQLEDTIARLRRIQRDEKTNQRDKVYAERAIIFAADRLAARLQSLGYLPNEGKQHSHRAGRQPTRLYEPVSPQQKAIKEVMEEREASDTLAYELETYEPKISPRTEHYARTGESRTARRLRRKHEKKRMRAAMKAANQTAAAHGRDSEAASSHSTVEQPACQSAS